MTGRLVPELEARRHLVEDDTELAQVRHARWPGQGAASTVEASTVPARELTGEVMTQTVGRQRSVLDVVLGALMVVAAVVILGHAVLATAVSVLLVAWVCLLSGVVAIVAALFRVGKGGFWSAALSGGLLLVLGLVFLRNPAATALTLTLIAGSMFLAIGITRLVAAVESATYRWVLVASGLVSTVLGLVVVLNVVEATLTLLGVLVGVQTLVDGLSLMVFGRPRRAAASLPEARDSRR